MKPIVRSFALLLAVAALPLAAQGFRHGRGPGMGPGMGGGPLFACLNLTDAQKASLKTLRAKYQPGFDSGRAAVFQAQRALRTAMADPSTSDGDLKALYDKASAARFTMLEQHRALLQESLTVLTPDQKAQWEKLRAERQQGLQNRRRGWGMGPGSGPAPNQN
ncbi:MAG TPA: Spy/CpxP family protein refolding chaperone [Holophagaceae bacterium]